jgi:hypothetical protein
MNPRMNHLTSVVRTAVKRRGMGDAPHFWKDAIPRADCRRPLGPAAKMGTTLLLQSTEGAEQSPASHAGRLKQLIQQNGEFARPILVDAPTRRARPLFA